MIATLAGAVLFAFSTFSVAGCPDGELKFSFRNLEVKKAFAILADFAGLRANIDQTISGSAPMTFGCTPWQTVAEDLARTYKLNLKIESGVMYVSRN